MIYLYVIFGRTGKILNKAGLFEVAKRSKDMSKSQVRIDGKCLVLPSTTYAIYTT